VPAVRAGGEARRLLTATQIAAFCSVDLKTIHNWADRGKIRGWRTSGRHLRFRRLDVVDFLRTYGFSIPNALREIRPRVVAVDADPEGLVWMRRALARRFEVASFEHVVDGLVALVDADPDVALLGDVSPMDARAVAARLREVEATRHVRIVTIATGGGVAGSADSDGGPDVATRYDVAERPVPAVGRGDTGKLREVMERVTGLD
jgi:excisionase family DNA binding protein